MKTSYSQIQSRLFQSYSKSKSKSPLHQNTFHAIKKSKQKIQEISNQQYSKAMKHMSKINTYQQNIKTKREKQKQSVLDENCTFKPNLCKSKYPVLMASKKNKEAMDKQINSSKNSLVQKKKSKLNIGLIKDFQNQNLTTNKNNKTANRLITWAKNKDKKIVNKTIQIQVQKSLSRQSYKSSLSNSKNTSYANLHKSKQVKLNIVSKYQTQNLSTSRTNISKQFGSFTPKNSSLQKLTIEPSQNYYYSAVQTPKNKSFYKQEKEINQKLAFNPQLKQINSLKDSKHLKVSHKLLQKQSLRGENNYYLRQAKANVKKQSLAQLLVKDKTYSRKYGK